MSLAKYKKVKYLGKGSYGAALLVCLKAKPEKKFVIKEIVVAHLKPAEREAAEGEAKVLSQMTHSNITMYVESFVEGSKLYIVMEHADGGDLTAAVKRRAASGMRWSENDVMRIFVQICLALKHVHEHNILHRDLKSQNIFLTQKGIVKLGDFGIAKVLDTTQGQAQTQIGTPYYLSPEICESKPYGRKSDVWSLGIVLFELLALELPFQAQSLPALVIRICSVDPDFKKVEEYSHHMIQLVKSLLQKNPDLRPDVVDMLNGVYFKKHISRLLSHTIRLGTGGAEGAVGSDEAPNVDMEGDIDEVDRNIERERQRQREEEEEREKNTKEALDRAEREARRKEEIDKLKKMKAEMARRKEEFSEDVVYVPSNQPVRPPPVVNPHGPRVDAVPQSQEYRRYAEEKRERTQYSIDNSRGGVQSDPRRRQHDSPSPSGIPLSEEEEALYKRALAREQAEKEKQERYLRHQAEQQRQQQLRAAQAHAPSDLREEEDVYMRAMDRGMDGYGKPDAPSGRDRGGERSLAEIRDERMRQRLEAERHYVANEAAQYNRERDDRDRHGGHMTHEEQLRRHQEEVRRQYHENQIKANEIKRRMYGSPSAENLFGAPAPERILARQSTQEEKFESAARQEFFANRAAAQQFKERARAYERGGTSVTGAAPSAPSGFENPHISADIFPGDRVAMIRAQKQYERDQEIREHERRMQAAAQEQLLERRRYEERMKQQGVIRRPSDASDHSKDDHASLDRFVEDRIQDDPEVLRRNREKEKALQREKEEQERISALEEARLHIKQQRRQIRDQSESPAAVAFEVNFDDDNGKKKAISPAIAALKAGKKSPSAAAPRQRRGWGAPSVPPVLSCQSKSSEPAEIVEEETRAYEDTDCEQESKNGARNLSRAMSAEEIPEDTLVANGLSAHLSGAVYAYNNKNGQSYDLSSLAYDSREVEEDDGAVMKVIEARKNREEQARDKARDVFRKLREQRKKEAAARAAPPASRGPRSSGRRSWDMGGAAVKRRSPPTIPVDIAIKPSKRLEEDAKSVAMMKTADGLYELSSSSGDSDGAGEVDDDLESTLDRYLEKLRQTKDRKPIEPKAEAVDRIDYPDAVEDEEEGIGVGDDDDGAMADLQCMLANALMESGPFTPLSILEDDILEEVEGNEEQKH